MSIKIQRIQSEEAGPFSPTQRTRAHITVPASVGFSDLQNSNIVFRMKPVIDNKGDGNLLPAYFAEEGVGSVRIGGCQSLIRNARATSKEFGLLNEMRDQNVIAANLNHFEDYSSCHTAAQGFNGGSGSVNKDLTNVGLSIHTPFLRRVQPTSIGVPVTELSQVVTAEVRCPLKHVDRLADGTRQFPNLAAGDITYRIELEDVRQIMSASPAGILPFKKGDVEPDYDLLAVNKDASNQIGSDDSPLKFNFAPGAAGAEGTVAIDNLEYCPFYVGAPVKLAFTDNAGDQTHKSTIKQLTAVANGTIEIVLDTPATVDAATAPNIVNSITYELNSNLVVDYEIDDIFLELHTLNLTPQQTNAAAQALNSLQIPYLEHRLVKKVLNETGDYSETLHVDAGCSNVAVFTPMNNELVSGYDGARVYRWSVDGNYMTNRDIRVGPQIAGEGQGIGLQVHNHFLQKYFGNIGKRLYQFEDVVENYNYPEDSNQLNRYNHSMYPLVMPMLNKDVIVNFQLRTDSATQMQTKEMFYLMSFPRMLTFKQGRLQVGGAM